MAAIPAAPCPYCLAPNPELISDERPYRACGRCGLEGPPKPTEDEATLAWNLIQYDTRGLPPCPTCGAQSFDLILLKDNNWTFQCHLCFRRSDPAPGRSEAALAWIKRAEASTKEPPHVG